VKSHKALTGTYPAEESNAWRRAAPVVALIVISPVLTELLMGIVRVSNLWLLLPEMAVYGTAALIIREVIRRMGRGWASMLLLGLVFGIAEECVILQTSLTPQFFPPGSFGWASGVQWIYLVALVWYEGVYAVVLPIYLVEMLFPALRTVPWLSRRGLIIACVFLVLSSFGVYELWHRIGLQRYGDSAYQVPALYVGIALLISAMLVGLALLPRKLPTPAEGARRRTPTPWLVGILAFGFGLVWFLFIALPYVPPSGLQGMSPLVPIAAGLVWIAAGLFILMRAAAGVGWNDRHRLALIFGMSLASMLGGTAVVLRAAPIDILGKFAFDLAALVLFIIFTVRLRLQPAP